MSHRYVLVLSLMSSTTLVAGTFPMSYGGRLTGADGTPVAGPVELNLKFFDAATGGNQLGATVDDQGVELAQGVFQAPLALDGPATQAVFGTGAQVFIEVTDVTHSKTYPRQEFSAVPYALRVPADSTTITYDANGQLTLTNPPGTAPKSLVQLDTSSRLPAVDGSQVTNVTAVGFSGPVAGDVTGTQGATVVSKLQGQTLVATGATSGNVLTWSGTQWAPAVIPSSVAGDVTGTFGATTVAKIQGKTIVATGASTGDFLKYDGTQWVPGSVSGASGGTVTSVSATAPLTITGNSTTAPTLGIGQAGFIADGYLSQGDWGVFNAKQPLITGTSVIGAGTLTTIKQNGLEAKPYGASAGQTGELRFDELVANGSTYVGFKAPDSITTSKIWTLPAADGTAGQLLKTDGAGVLSWISGSAPTGSASGDLSGTFPGPTVATVGSVSAANVASGATAANAATNANTASTIVKRDGSGNFTAGTVTANLIGNVTGNASTATSASSFSGSLAGDVTGTQGATAVALVGSVSAANVASGANAANAATNANTASTIVKRDGSGNFTAGTVTANLVGNVTGNASTATSATSASSFSGSLAGDVTGTQGATAVALVGSVSAANVASGANAANAATNANTAATIVKRDGSGNFTAGTITANLIGNVTGNASTATSATSATSATNFSGSLAGDVTGTQGATAVALVGSVSAANVASGANAANAATNANTASTIVKRDGSGNFTAGTITANLVGNATNVTGTVAATNGGTGISSTATFPASGVIVTEAGTETLTNKTLTTPSLSGATLTGSSIFGTGDGTGSLTAATLRGPAGVGSNIAGVETTFDASNGTGTGGSGGFTFRTAPVGSTGSTADTLAPIMRIANNGYVGIGTTSPAGALQVSGGQVIGAFVTANSTTINWNQGNIQATNVAPGTITFTTGSMVNGANYTLILNDEAAGTYTLSSADITTWKCLPACASAQIQTTSGKDTVLTVIRAGSTAYVSWLQGF